MEAKHNHIDTSALHALNDKTLRKLRTQASASARVLKAKRKATVVDEPAAENVEATHAALPSRARQGVAIVAWLLSYAGTFYGTITLLDSVVTAAMALTSSQFLLFLIAFIGIVVALIAAASASVWVYDAVMAFDAVAIKARVVSWHDRFNTWREERAAVARLQAVVDMEDALRAGL